ncbi:glycosyltransferase family protein [Polaromonas sp.]|uniref:glycosyltransferase family protein n=1 Tax=Polaromonas sp. TaxID=1869339 RepID=UPI0032652FD0
MVAIVQARMTSTRLPGKVLMPIMGRPMLSYQLERMRHATRLDRIVVATTVNASDDPIASFCESEGVDVTRGSEADVLSRYVEAARRFGAQTVVRITSDCPLMDPALLDEALNWFEAAAPRCDYLSNMLAPSFPYGLAVEIMTAEALYTAGSQARDPQEREHVTPFIYWRPERFRLHSYIMTPDLSGHRWTVDTPEDFELVSRIVEALYPSKPEFGMNDVLALMARHPKWRKINAHIGQKQVSQG